MDFNNFDKLSLVIKFKLYQDACDLSTYFKGVIDKLLTKLPDKKETTPDKIETTLKI